MMNAAMSNPGEPAFPRRPPVKPAGDEEKRSAGSGMQAGLASLLDRTAPKDLGDLDLAHAVCTVLWPKYPRYEGDLQGGGEAEDPPGATSMMG